MGTDEHQNVDVVRSFVCLCSLFLFGYFWMLHPLISDYDLSRNKRVQSDANYRYANVDLFEAEPFFLREHQLDKNGQTVYSNVLLSNSCRR